MEIHNTLKYYKYALENAHFIPFKCAQARFTKRETQCLTCLILGMTAKQIGKTLSISPRTVTDYITFIKDKFNCVDRYKVVTKALLAGFPINDFLAAYMDIVGLCRINK